MDSDKDVVRVKEEPSDTWTNAGDDYDFNLVNSCKAENFETSNELSLQENLDGKIFIECEFKDVKLELKSPSATTRKSEYQSPQTSVKKENEKLTISMNEEKLIILKEEGFNYDNNSLFQVTSRLKLAEYSKVTCFEKAVETKSLHASKMCKVLLHR